MENKKIKKKGESDFSNKVYMCCPNYNPTKWPNHRCCFQNVNQNLAVAAYYASANEKRGGPHLITVPRVGKHAPTSCVH